MSIKSLKKVESKKSLNIKVPDGLDERLKKARSVARENGMQFNVSDLVTAFLERELKKVEKEFGIEIEKEVENKVKVESKVESCVEEKVENNEEFDFDSKRAEKQS
jgi:arsenate reductase-like glutaredoxin family protein